MKVAKTLVLEYLEQELLKNNKQGLETKVIAAALGMQRSNVSTILNQLVKEGILVKGNTRPVQYQLKEIFVENPFSISAAGASPGGCMGRLRAQPSRKLMRLVLRSISALARQ